MTQDQKQFQSDFMEMVRESAAQNNVSVETELTKSFIEYVIEAGEALAPEICECSSNPATERFTTRYKLNAYDYSEVSGILDMFVTIYYEGQTPTLPISTAQKMLNELAHTFNVAIEGKEAKSTYKATNPDVADVLDMIKEEYENNKIELIRLFVLSNGYAVDDLDIDIEGELGREGRKITTEYHFWDMEELRRAELARQNNSEIIIDLKEEYQSPLECIELHDSVNNITSYLAIIPALTLAKVYNKHKVRLIDQNVRNFLGGKVKVNKEMADTIATRPNLFFCFNNGISSTASNVTIERDEETGRKYITRLRNWHIVNGGQTTSTIFYAMKKSRTGDTLQNAYVAVKITEVPAALADDENLRNLVPDIAKYANSQTKIKDSDLSANARYMLDIQYQSEREKSPTDNTYWYFERLRGQFITEKGNIGGVGTIKVRNFEAERPQSQRFNKTDIAKLEMAWMKKPFEACKGGEVCFDKFWKIIKEQTPNVDAAYFHNVVAKMIIYQYIDRMLKITGNKGYASIICNYTIALLSLRSQEKLDLDYIWRHQEVQDDLKDVIKSMTKEISEYLTVIGTQGNKNPQTESKKVDFWNQIQNKTLSITIPESVLLSADEDNFITALEQAEIDEAQAWGIENWKNLAKWGKREGKSYLSIMEKKKLDHIAATFERNETPKVRLVQDCLRIKRLAEDNGFTENRIY